MMRKMLRSKKGISTILAALLLVVIVVVMGGMVYAFSSGLLTGMMGTSQAATNPEALTLDTYSVQSNSSVILYCRNIGGTSVTIDTAYITQPNGVTSVATSIIPNPDPIDVNSVSQVTVSGASGTFSDSGTYTVKCVTDKGSQFVYSVSV